MQKIHNKYLNKEETLSYFAKYIWWKSKEEAVKNEDMVFAQAMCYATVDEWHLLAPYKSEMISAIKNAQPGWFDKKSWSFWHYILGLAKSDDIIPDLPKRGFLE